MEKEFELLKQKKNKLFIISFLLFFLFIIIFLMLWSILQNTQILIIGTCFVFAIIVFYTYELNKLKKQFKNNILKNCFKEINSSFEFSGDIGLTTDEVYESLVLTKNSGNKFVASDLLTGEISNHTFRSSDVYVYYIVSTGKSSHRVTVFKGRFYIIDLNKNVNGHIVIREEGDILRNVPKGLSLIELEGIQFNKKFNVYANNELETFKQIKPQQIERITKLEFDYEGKLLMAIKNNKLYFGFWNNNDYFELNNYETFNEIKISIEYDLKLLEKIINILD